MVQVLTTLVLHASEEMTISVTHANLAPFIIPTCLPTLEVLALIHVLLVTGETHPLINA